MSESSPKQNKRRVEPKFQDPTSWWGQESAGQETEGRDKSVFPGRPKLEVTSLATSPSREVDLNWGLRHFTQVRQVYAEHVLEGFGRM